MSPNVHFIGLLRSPVSWAKAGRELVRALVRAGAYVSAVSLKGHLYDEAFHLNPAVEEAIRRPRREGWDVALDYPPNFARLDGAHRAGILIYEADRLPPHWVEAVNKYLDSAFVPSRFACEVAVASGIPEARLALAPFGVDREIFRPDGPAAAVPTGRSFNFLAVAAPHIRKGLAELTEAFRRAFAPSDDVGLVIKCPPLAGLGKRPWEYAGIDDFLGEEPGGRISLLTGSLSEEEMGSLYRACDVYCQPSYGESFGLAALEALACGRPVIATGWGGVLSFLNEENAWLADFEMVDAASFSYDWKDGPPVCAAQPDVAHLAELLRRAYEDEEVRRHKANAGLKTAESFLWSATVRAAFKALCSSR
ncbi:MAG: glycosyltransferase [Planctomycetota bacterium]|jgi:glycosyltransferase involved in cell wall biosynthesis